MSYMILVSATKINVCRCQYSRPWIWFRYVNT